MITLNTVEIMDDDSYEILLNEIPQEYIDKETVEKLKNNISTQCRKLVIEYPYHDKDYLSTYYIHYSQKFQQFKKECVRIHILGIQDEYYGYITLRPTVSGTKLGASYINPSILIKEQAYLMLNEFDVHIRGQELKCACFPWMKQETDIAVCAHVSLWTVLKYYGNKYKNYLDTTMGDIVEKIQEEGGRKTPSNGLTPIQVADILKKFNFSPIVRGGEKHRSDMFLDEVIAYIESGIPVIGFISSKQHAVSIMGHGKINYEILKNPKLLNKICDNKTGIILSSKLISSLYVMEDNFFPYRKVGRELPSGSSDVDYFLSELAYAVIPLYSRMQLVYNEIYARYVALVESRTMNWDDIKVSRIYITSANSLKREIYKQQDISRNLREIILSLEMPKFVWCIDISDPESFEKNKTAGKIIIDTTCSTLEKEPWLLMHDSEKIKFTNRSKKYEIDENIEPYNNYINNLKSVIGKEEL